MTEILHNHPSPESASSTTSASPDGSNGTDITSISLNGHEPEGLSLVKTESTTSNGSAFIAPKADKPRPHVCTTCSRSFARLEHLKRHERSHTKEKPFECPECTRCFARRDLLLRHQQKLHLTATSSTRAKPVRRESTSGVSTTSARVRKNSTATTANTSTTSLSSTNGSSRQRANTLSHIDISGLGLFSGGTAPDLLSTPLSDQVNIVNHLNSPHGPSSLQRRATTDSRGHSRASTLTHVPRLGLDTSWRNPLPTVPSGTAIHQMYDFVETPYSERPPTINPQHLHLDDSIDSLDSPFVENFEWMGGFNPSMSVHAYPEHAAAATSPSGLSTDSPMMAPADHNYNNHAYYAQPSHLAWQQVSQQLQTPDPTQMTTDFMAAMQPDYGVSSDYGNVMHQQQHATSESYYPTPPPYASLSPDIAHHTFSPQFQQPMFPLDPSLDPSLGQFDNMPSAFASFQIQGRPLAVESITEATRQALMVSLSQPSTYGQRKQSITNQHSSRRDSSAGSTLPSLHDLQRYVAAYIEYFHPHQPFLHIPTLTFDSPSYTSNLRVAYGHGNGQGGIIGGGGCLILAMAAIGALYEFEASASKELFDSARKMIQLYLEERRKADLAAAISSARHNDNPAQNTPLWLVQAMLLNVIYGHQCGDKVSGDIASTHCAALVSLGRAADLLSPAPDFAGAHMTNGFAADGLNSPALEKVQTNDSIAFTDPWGFAAPSMEDENAWRQWVVAEERKRTLYAIFNMSSLLVSGYNHSPAIMNSEIQLDLPCEEELWYAESPAIWNARGGANLARQKSIPFAAALSRLLMASQSQNHQQAMHPGSALGSGMLMADLPPSELKPSTFGCLVLINALHNFVWETRQRHSGIRWTTQESESMQAHIEPALRAWQAAWASNPTHSLERPNPFGMGPLSADSIPLLDLAYVRLYVNLGVSKEAFWQRDFDSMADELARGTDIIQHADYSGSSGHSSHSSEASGSRKTSLDERRDQKLANLLAANATTTTNTDSTTSANKPTPSKRERQLRRAAFYAADSLSMAQKLGVTFADFTSRDLPMQSAMCAFDSAQVLAEWCISVQERVGLYLGILGLGTTPSGTIAMLPDLSTLPSPLLSQLLEDEDIKLLSKTRDILIAAEAKMAEELGTLDQDPGRAMAVMSKLPSCSSNAGFGAQILGVASYWLRRARVWPVTGLMAQALEVQAGVMGRRAEGSVGMGVVQTQV